MRIDTIDLYLVSLPLRKPWVVNGRSFDRWETVLVRIRSGEYVGWGESSPGTAPMVRGEWAGGVMACLRDWLAGSVVGQEVESGDHLQEQLKDYRGVEFAKAALDVAWWDLLARVQNRPLAAVLGGRRPAVELGVRFDRMESSEDFLTALREASAAGYSRIGLTLRPGWDVAMLGAVRQEFPTEVFHVDGEAGMSFDQMDILYRLDDFGLAMVEQPFAGNDLVGHAMLQEAIRTPVCLDEGITSVEQLEMALELKSCRFVNVQPCRVGGLTSALAIHDICQEHEVPCYVGAELQSGLGLRLGLALAARQQFTYPAEYLDPAEWFEEDLVEPVDTFRDDKDGKRKARLWSKAGLGVEPEPYLLDKYAIDRAQVK